MYTFWGSYIIAHKIDVDTMGYSLPIESAMMSNE